MGDTEDSPPSFEVVFCAFSLASLELNVPDGMVSVAQHLAAAEKYLDIDWSGLSVWHPDNGLDNLKYRLRLRKPALVTEFAHDDDKLYDLEQFADGSYSPRQRNPLIQSLEQYQRSAARHRRSLDGSSLQDVYEAREGYQRQVDERLFEPQLEAALGEADPSRRSLLVLRAQLLRSVLGAVPRINNEIDWLAEENRDDLLPLGMAKQLESMMKTICQLTKVIAD